MLMRAAFDLAKKSRNRLTGTGLNRAAAAVAVHPTNFSCSGCPQAVFDLVRAIIRTLEAGIATSTARLIATMQVG